jgi:hypothetical protein
MLLSIGTPGNPVVHRTLHCSLSGKCHVSRSLGFGVVDCWSLLSSCGTGQSGAFWLCRLTYAFCSGDCDAVGAVDRWAKLTVASLSHRTVRWIIAERTEKTRERLVREVLDQGTRQCLVHTGQCSVRHWLHQFLYAPNFVEFLQVFFFVCLWWTLCTWEK